MKEPICRRAKWRLRSCFSIAFFGLAQFSASTQNVDIDWLTIERSIEYVVQDSDGFIWFSREGAGLFRYDGYDLKRYLHDEKDSTSLGGAIVRDLSVDDFGNLWVQSIGGLGPMQNLYDRKSDSFVRLKDRMQPYIRDGSGGTWYIGQTDSTSTLYKLEIDPEDSNRWISRKPVSGDEIILNVWQTSKGDFWLGGVEMKLFRFDPFREEITGQYQLEPADMYWNMWEYARYFWNSLQEDSKGNLFACSNAAGTFQFDPEEDQWSPLFYASDSKKGSLPISHLFIDHEDNHWYKHHIFEPELFLFDRANGSYQLFDTHNVPIFQDDQNYLWLWHNRTWPYDDKARVKVRDRPFQLIGESSGLDVTVITNLEVIDSTVFILAEDVYQYYPESDSLALFLELVGAGGQDVLMSMAKDRFGIYWGATWNSGVYRYDDTRGHLEVFRSGSENAKGLLGTNFWSVHSSDSGVYVLGGQSPPWVQFYDFEKGQFTTDHGIVQRPHKGGLATDHLDRSWGVDPGLVAVSMMSDTSKVFRLPPDKHLGAFTIASGGSRYLWTNSFDGLRRMDTETMTVKQFDLPEGFISGTYPDKSGNSWFYFPGQLGRLDTLSGEIRYYKAADGMMLEGEPGLASKVVELDGWLYFAGANGVLRFHPDSLKDNLYNPPVHLTELSMDNVPVAVGDTVSDIVVLRESLLECAEITLPPGANFSLKFAALNYENPEANQYRFQLLGYDEEWIEAGTQRIATYTNLWEGTYTFQVMGSNNHGLWNPEVTTIDIMILPPLWRTWWAYSIYCFILIGLLVTGRQLVVRRERLRGALELEQVELKKIRELDEVKTQFFTNISHEFRTPLTLILGPLKKMVEGTFEGDRNFILKMMFRNANRLLHLINQLLDLSKLDAGKLALQAQETDMVRFCKQVAANYQSLAESRGMHFYFHHRPREIGAWIDVDKMEKVLHNLLSNAFKFTADQGEIGVYLDARSEEWIEIEVSDTGKGIPKDQVEKIFDRFHQVDASSTRGQEGTGIGMALTRELVELHHGDIRVETELGKGTKFTVVLPAGDDLLQPEDKKEGPDREASHIGVGMEVLDKPTRPSQGAEDPARETILIVEDNSDMRTFISMSIGESFATIEAVDGEEGLATAFDQQPDLVISDVMMPKMDGVTMCERLKTDERTSHIPVILLTAKADKASRLTGLETGADDYLAKPFDEDELRILINNRIEQRRRLRAKFEGTRDFGPKEVTVNSVDERFLERLSAVLEEHISNVDFSMEDFARRSGMSLRQLNRKLTSMTGMASSLFVRRFRLKRAAQLLAQDADNVSQIAYQVGFNNLSYFTRAFKEEFGVTPSQYAPSPGSREKL